MKGLLIFVAVCAIGGVALYYYGGYASFDPTKAGKEAKDAIKPGMSWKQVISTCKNPPPHYKPIIKQTKQGIEFVKPGPEILFNEKEIGDRLASNGFDNGFTFPYRFSEACAFEVYFDSTGTVVRVEDMLTMRDLLQYD